MERTPRWLFAFRGSNGNTPFSLLSQIPTVVAALTQMGIMNRLNMFIRKAISQALGTATAAVWM
jgi:hypothetical protein